MTLTELELVARVIHRIRTGRNMPNRAPLDEGEQAMLEAHRLQALAELQKQADPLGLTVTIE